MSQNIFEELLARVHKNVYDDDGLLEYVKTHFIPLGVLGRLVEKFDGTKGPVWEDIYYTVIPAYFRSDGGKRAMKDFIQNGCSVGEEAKAIFGLLACHPRWNEVHNGKVKEENMDEVEKTLYDALSVIYPIAFPEHYFNRLSERRFDLHGLREYIQNNFIPLEMFAHFVRVNVGSGREWENVYYNIPTYFRSVGGKRAMQIFAVHGCKPEDLESIDMLTEFYRKFDEVYEEKKNGKNLSADDMLFVKVLDKIDLIYDSSKQNQGQVQVGAKSKISTQKQNKTPYENAIVAELLKILKEQHISIKNELVGHKPQVAKYTAFIDGQKIFTLSEPPFKLEVYRDEQSPLIIEGQDILEPLETQIHDYANGI